MSYHLYRLQSRTNYLRDFTGHLLYLVISSEYGGIANQTGGVLFTKYANTGTRKSHIVM